MSKPTNLSIILIDILINEIKYAQSMDSTSEQLELLWYKLLSSQPDLIRDAFNSLDPASKKTVIAHLERMVIEPGWQPEQRLSARAALLALEDFIDQER